MATEENKTEDVSKYRAVYDDTLYFVDGIVEQYGFYPEILKALGEGKSEIELKKRYMLKAIDETWVTFIEDSLPALDRVIRKPGKFIEEREQVMPIELSRNINNRSIQHLAQHTNYISKIEGDEITPSKILNVFREETLLTYENKFVNTLINRLYIFVNKRYSVAAKAGVDEKNTKLDYENEFLHGDKKAKVHFSIELSEAPEEGIELKNYTYTKDLWKRVCMLNSIVTSYTDSDFAKSMDRQYIRPPVIRTNAILKNKDLRQCLALWEFIESYESTGYDLLVEEDLEKIDEKYIRHLYSVVALQYLIFRYNIKNEFQEDKMLDFHLSDTVFKPRFIEELKKISADEFDIVGKRIRPQIEQLLGDEKSINEAIDLALLTDAALKNEEYRPLYREFLKKEKRAFLWKNFEKNKIFHITGWPVKHERKRKFINFGKQGHYRLRRANLPWEE